MIRIILPTGAKVEVDTATEAQQILGLADQKASAEEVFTRKIAFKNGHRDWTHKNDTDLWEMKNNGASIFEMCNQLGRTEKAVKARLYSLRVAARVKAAKQEAAVSRESMREARHDAVMPMPVIPPPIMPITRSTFPVEL